MRFHYAGKFKGVESLKAQREPGPSDVKFKEPEIADDKADREKEGNDNEPVHDKS